MLLESLKQFDWLNEPYQVRFDEQGMHVSTKYRTDFWCCARYNFYKDDGHFFFSSACNDFCCDLCWAFADVSDFDQCGIMLRRDSGNWFKAAIMYDNAEQPMLATCLTQDGYSDLETRPLPLGTNKIHYCLKRRKGCYMVGYSLDGHNFSQLRKFYLIHDNDEIDVGAYICSPQRENFEAVLENITIS